MPNIKLTTRQQASKDSIVQISNLFGIYPRWAYAVAMTESSLGEQQKSPTGCSGVFQMSGIAMEDLRLAMREYDDDLVDIVCGVAYLRLLLRRHGTIEHATEHFCDPKDREFYLERVKRYMEDL